MDDFPHATGNRFRIFIGHGLCLSFSGKKEEDGGHKFWPQRMWPGVKMSGTMSNKHAVITLSGTLATFRLLSWECLDTWECREKVQMREVAHGCPSWGCVRARDL